MGARQRRLSLALALAGAPLVVGCGDTDVPGPGAGPSRPLVHVGSGFEVVVDPDGRSLALVDARDAAHTTTLATFPADGLLLGRLESVDDATNYDPWPLVASVPLYPAPDVVWLAPSRFDVTTASAKTAELVLTYEGGATAKLSIEQRADGRFALALVPAAADGLAYVRLRARTDPTEQYYGLGEYFDQPTHRGQVRAMQIEVDGSVESTNNEAHVPVPLLIGTRGWGLFVESYRPGVFEVASSEDDLVQTTFGTGTATAAGLAFHLYGASHPLDVTKHYYDTTVYPRLPARWALGPWVWRDESADQAQVEGDLDAMRDLDLPTTGYWIDRPYATAVNTFDWNPPQFPDPAAMIAKLHDLGFRTAIWHTPYLDEDAQKAATAALRAEATAGGYYPVEHGLLLNKWGPPLDFTNGEAFAWWQGLLGAYTDAGVEGFKLDYGEDVVTGLTPGRNAWRFADGSDEQTMHAAYQLFYHRLYAETLPADGGFLLCRHGTFGDQQNGPIIWPGDLDASFAKHRDEVTPDDGGDSYVAVGGLPASLAAGLSLGPSGFPFYGADTGGYRHSPPDKELFTRWFEQTALSTVMQIGNSSSTVAWEADPATGFDAEMLGWYRRYTRLHLRLFPYEWTYATKLLVDGRPIQRALGLAHPELGQHPADEYMFGDWLLVAPVVERGARARQLTLPAGRWIDFWTGEVHEVGAGGTTLTVAAPLDTLPLFLREGALVPMLRPTIDTIGPTTEPGRVDSYATKAGPLWIRVAPGPASTFDVFDGSHVEQERTASGVDLGWSEGDELGGEVVLEIVATPGASAVEVDGAPLDEVATPEALDAIAAGWTTTGEVGGTVLIKLGAGAHQVRVTAPPP